MKKIYVEFCGWAKEGLLVHLAQLVPQHSSNHDPAGKPYCLNFNNGKSLQAEITARKI